jgi:hypothetical protein
MSFPKITDTHTKQFYDTILRTAPAIKMILARTTGLIQMDEIMLGTAGSFSPLSPTACRAISPLAKREPHYW